MYCVFCLQSSRHSKLEKADILEMTVKHLRNLQRVQMTGKFRGFCIFRAGLALTNEAQKN